MHSLIALMLGRLRLSAADAITFYVRLAGTVFSDKKRFSKEIFKATVLEKEMQAIVKLSCGNEDEFMMDFSERVCKTYGIISYVSIY